MRATYYFRIYPYIDNDAVLAYKTDGTAPSAHATVKAKVKPPRDTSPSCPQAAGDALITTTIGVPVTTGDVSLGSRNPGSSPLRIALSSGVSLHGGAVAYNGDNTFTYTPKPGFTGQDAFTYWMDNHDCQMLGLVKATVNPAGGARNADKTAEAAAGTAAVGGDASGGNGGGNGGGGSFPPALLLPLLAIGWCRARMTGRKP
ncbi:MAG: Ig-like domain-containing protein [Candidatus Thiothrix singaporensis]|uniref:Ig-like domain-containing protein n=1 Tax=Candidatus Thiothrix singaporensis TaxID=2799669 RepID=A0A7L6AUL8_9GAMM|nr:MAG: Ig-like domain-containing protein [Candidatus Thiothrix singaporensis]